MLGFDRILFRSLLLQACIFVLKVSSKDSMLFFLPDGVFELFTLLPGSEDRTDEGLFLVHHALLIEHLARSSNAILKCPSTCLVCRRCVLPRVDAHSLMPLF